MKQKQVFRPKTIIPKQHILRNGKENQAHCACAFHDNCIFGLFWGFIGLLAISYLSLNAEFSRFFYSLCPPVLLYGAPAAPFSQPRNLLGGIYLSLWE